MARNGTLLPALLLQFPGAQSSPLAPVLAYCSSLSHALVRCTLRTFRLSPGDLLTHPAVLLLSRHSHQDASLAAALVDLILHHGEVFYLKGPSFRLKGRSLDSELVPAASTSTNGTDAGLEAQHRVDGPEGAVH